MLDGKGDYSHKKLITWILALAWGLVLTGLCNRSMDYIIHHEPSISGIVKEVRDDSILISIEAAGYPAGTDCEVSLDVENPDSCTHVSIGDEVVVCYDGNIAESDPLQITTVYAITLRTPAKQKAA